MQFFNPYLKKKTEHTYADIFKQFKDLNAEEKSHFIELCVMQVQQMKKDILKDNKDKKANKIMPFMHIIMFLVTYYLCRENRNDENFENEKKFRKDYSE